MILNFPIPKSRDKAEAAHSRILELSARILELADVPAVQMFYGARIDHSEADLLAKRWVRKMEYFLMIFRGLIFLDFIP